MWHDVPDTEINDIWQITCKEAVSSMANALCNSSQVAEASEHMRLHYNRMTTYNQEQPHTVCNAEDNVLASNVGNLQY